MTPSRRDRGGTAVARGGVNLWEEEPGGSQTEDGAGQQAEEEVALAPAEELCAAVQRHRDHGEEPELPVQWADLGAAKEREGQACEQHRAIDGHAACAEAGLISGDVERAGTR